MNDYPTADDFKGAYLGMEAALRDKSKNDRLCDYCLRLDITSIFATERSKDALRNAWPNVEYYHGLLSDLARRDRCPFCRLLWRLLRDGNGNCCKKACRKTVVVLENVASYPGLSKCIDSLKDSEVSIEFYLPTNSQRGWVKVGVAGQTVARHLAYGDLHFVYPTQTDHFRIREWTSTCEGTHRDCNEQYVDEETSMSDKCNLYGYSEGSLRVIDVERRRIVQLKIGLLNVIVLK
jgi:hypothetical protein